MVQRSGVFIYKCTLFVYLKIIYVELHIKTNCKQNNLNLKRQAQKFQFSMRFKKKS